MVVLHSLLTILKIVGLHSLLVTRTKGKRKTTKAMVGAMAKACQRGNVAMAKATAKAVER